MAAIDSVGSFVANPSSTFTSTAASPGDSLNVRSFATPGSAYLLGTYRRGATKGGLRLTSPRLHDNVTGINYETSEVVATLAGPMCALQPMYSADTLTLQVTGGASETDGATTLIYYTNAQGLSANLAAWGDIQNNITYVKPFYTAVTNSATIGTWTDTVITTTDNQLQADEYYAVLGYMTDTALAAVGVKGPDTSSLRVCGPGTTTTLDTTDWFVRLSNQSGLPCIPVIQANNRASTYVSTWDVAASTAANVTLWCALLTNPVNNG